MARDEIESCKVGDSGVADSALIPSGVVEINGQRFSARAKGPSINSGDPVVVVGGDVGGLLVQRCGERDADLPDFGKVIYGSFGDRAKAVAKQAEEERLAELTAWKKRAKIWRGILGVAFGGFAFYVCSQGEGATFQGNVIGLVAGFLWANVVFRTLDSLIRKFDDELVRLVTPASIGALVCAAIGLFTAIRWGTAVGLCLAIAGTLVGGFVVPAIGCLLLSSGSR